MKIHDIGGEFALIDRLARQSPVVHPDLVAGIGDDSAVIRGSFPDGDYLLVTTDMLVETTHFRRDWATPTQVGIKAVACNVSDIAAMGGIPTFMFVSLALAADTEVAWIETLYTGMAEACRRYGVVLAGGLTLLVLRGIVSSVSERFGGVDFLGPLGVVSFLAFAALLGLVGSYLSLRVLLRRSV